MPLHMSCFTHFWNVPLSCITFHRYSNCKKVKINLKTSYKIRLCIFRLILKNMDNGLRKSNNEARKLANILKKSSITVIFKWWIWAVTFRLTCTWLLFRCGIFYFPNLIDVLFPSISSTAGILKDHFGEIMDILCMRSGRKE